MSVDRQELQRTVSNAIQELKGAGKSTPPTPNLDKLVDGLSDESAAPEVALAILRVAQAVEPLEFKLGILRHVYVIRTRYLTVGWDTSLTLQAILVRGDSRAVIFASEQLADPGTESARCLHLIRNGWRVLDDSQKHPAGDIAGEAVGKWLKNWNDGVRRPLDEPELAHTACEILAATGQFGEAVGPGRLTRSIHLRPLLSNPNKRLRLAARQAFLAVVPPECVGPCTVLASIEEALSDDKVKSSVAGGPLRDQLKTVMATVVAQLTSVTLSKTR
jgi:hypothetical protein